MWAHKNDFGFDILDRFPHYRAFHSILSKKKILLCTDMHHLPLVGFCQGHILYESHSQIYPQL
jgi:hypothetical protein